jgi:tRNA(adenine34) deaminase
MSQNSSFMNLALDQAKLAFKNGEVPVGAVLVKDDKVIAKAHNQTYISCNPVGHAEILVLQMASRDFFTTYLENCDLYVTLEPCPMCAHAISLSRIKRLYFGAYDPKGGGVDHGPKLYMHSSSFHKPEVYGGILEEECGLLLKDFFKNKR